MHQCCLLFAAEHLQQWTRRIGARIDGNVVTGAVAANENISLQNDYMLSKAVQRISARETPPHLSRRNKRRYKRRERWDEKIERQENGARRAWQTIESVENRVPIYKGVHEDELDSGGAVEVSPLRKYPILPERPGAAVPNYRDGMAWFILRGNFIAPYARRDRSLTVRDHENAILIMWPIRGSSWLSGRDCRCLQITT